MNKQDLVNAVAEKTGLTKKDTSAAIDAVFESITEALVNREKIHLHGFGNFEVKQTSARKARNPKTGEEISLEARDVPKFRPSQSLKAAVGG